MTQADFDLTRAMDGTLDHVEMNVADLEAASEFYDWFLGELRYRPYQRWEEGRSWVLGSTYIVVALAEKPHREHRFHRKRPGLNHLAFHASSKERVDEMKGKLEERGISILYGSPEPGDYHPYALYFEGPERLKIEYVWPGPTQEVANRRLESVIRMARR